MALARAWRSVPSKLSGRIRPRITASGMHVRFERGRVVEVWVPGHPRGTVASGYLLDGGLLLTAGHVVDGAVGGSCEARTLGSPDWIAAEVAWRGERCDAALLRIAEREAGADPLRRLGKVSGHDRVACRALGFPFAQAKLAGRRRDTEDLSGEIAPLTALNRNHLTIHVVGSVPTPDDSEHSPWEGMSGAALFSGPLIVGVIIIDPAHFGTDRLEAIPVSRMAQETGFRAVLTDDPGRPPALQSVEDVDVTRGVLRQAYRPLPPRASPETLRRAGTYFLVGAEYGVVPFRGRHVELDELEAWTFGAAGLELALVLGAGGTGKSRLASELCRRSQARGAVAGFLETELSQNAIAGLRSVGAPLLVVIDEAPARLDDVTRLLIRLADGPSSAPRRVLLLSRRPGEWWEQLLRRRLAAHPDARFAYELATDSVMDLSPVAVSEFDRTDAYRTAAAAFASRMESSDEGLPLPDMSQELFEQILFVHLAALSALDGKRQLVEGSLVREDLLRHALERESRYWDDMAIAARLQITPALRDRAVAVATLTVAEGEDAAAHALNAVPDLYGASEERRRNIARWLHELYPLHAGQARSRPFAAAQWFRPLTPIVLGDALLGMVLEDGGAPNLATRLMQGARAEQAKRTLTVLTHAARTYGSADKALRSALAAHFAERWDLAMEVAQEAGDPLGEMLAATLEDDPRGGLARRIEPLLPRRSIALREFAATVTRQALDDARQRLPGLERDGEVARLANDLSNRLTDLERRDEALSAIEEAVAIYRKLVGSDATGYLSGLASSLNNQSGCLSRLGRFDLALAAIEEAVRIYRRLGDVDPDDVLAELATCLINAAYVLGQLGRGEQALEVIEESVEIYRELADARPDDHLADLAGALNSLAAQLANLARHAGALAAIEDAVAIYDELASARPDAFLADLAQALNNKSGCLSTLGRPIEALVAIEEAVATFRQLAAARPRPFKPDLATSLHTRAVLLGKVGRHEDALRAIGEAVELRHALSEEHADVFLPDFARSLNVQASCLSEVARSLDGLGVIDQAVAINRTLVRASEAHRSTLAASLDTRSFLLASLNRREEGLNSIAEAVSIRRQLAQAQPDSFLADLAASLDNMAVSLALLGYGVPALSAFEEATAAYRPLAESQPDPYVAELAESLNNQSNLLGLMARPREALARIQEAVGLRRQLASANPNGFMPALAESLHNQAVLYARLGDDDRALATLDEVIEIRRKLADAHPSQLPGLAISLGRQAIQLANVERHMDAVPKLADALRIMVRVLESDLNGPRDVGARILRDYVGLHSLVGRAPDYDLVDRMKVILDARSATDQD